MAARPSPFPGLFLMSLLALLLGGCDLFYNNMAAYYAQHTGTAEVTGVVGKSLDFLPVTDSGTILIPPGMTILGLILDNPHSLTVRQTLVNNTAAAGSVAGQQTGPGEIEVVVTGAEEGDDYVLTLQMQSPDGLRSFTPYVLNLKCVPFEAALLDFTIDGTTPWDFNPDKTSFIAVVPHGAASVVLEAATVAPDALLNLYGGTDDTGPLLSSGAGTVTLPGVSLNSGSNDFYLLVTAPGLYPIRGYNLTIYRQKDDSKAIVAFNITSPLPAEGDINEAAKTIDVIVPYGTPLNSITAFVTHTGASVSPPSGTPRNFSTPQTYTVTAADGSQENYTVTVTPVSNSPKAITGFYFAIGGKNYGIGGGTETDSGSLTGTNITITVPYGTGLTTLPAPTITHSGASCTRLTSGTSFASTVNYQVTAADGSQENYTVTVQAAALDSISLSSGPATTVYPTGASLDTTGLVISGQDTLGTAILNLTGWTCSSLDSASRGTKNITVTHTASGKTTTFNVTVKNNINTLGSLLVSGGYSLNPAFSPAEENYTITIPHGTAGPLTLTAALADLNASFTEGSSGSQTITINTGANPGAFCGSQTVKVKPEYDSGAVKTYTVTVYYANQINVSGTISAGDIPVITFGGSPPTIAPGGSITITTGQTVTEWYITVDGPATAGPFTEVPFNAPMTPGAYTVNVLAEIDGTLYSGSFTLTVN